MKITGQILKENRERKGITLSEVSLSTKITIKTLVAIEDGDPRNLPPKTFLRGFVRSYAVFLGCDVEEVLRTFHEEMGSTLSRPTPTLAGDLPSELNAAATEAAKPSGEPPTAKPPVANRSPLVGNRDTESVFRDQPSLVTRGGIVVGILLLIILIVFFRNKMASYEAERAKPEDAATVETAAQPPELTPAPPSATAPEGGADASAAKSPPDGPVDADAATAAVAAPTATPKPSPSPTATPKPSPTATPKPSPSPPATPKPSPSPTATPKPSPAATPKPSPSPTATPKPSPPATPKPSPSPTATPKPSPAATPKPSPSPTPAAKAVPTQDIVIEALDQVEVEATIDGEAPRILKLRSEQLQAIKAKRKVILKLSDGGAVNIIVNGVDRGVPGDLGKPTRVELP